MASIRRSTISDKNEMEKLIAICFGDRQKELNILNGMEDKYYLYLIDDKIIAMTGMAYCDYYRGLEVLWTCTHPDYRGKGYMNELFAVMLSGTADDVYCSCWRQSNNQVNLYNIMKRFEFEKVLDSRLASAYGHNCFRDGKDKNPSCVFCVGEGCYCAEDLYLRKTKKII